MKEIGKERRGRFVARLVMLSLTLPPRQVLEDAALEGYWIALCDVTEENFNRAVDRALRELRFMPPPSELRDMAGRGLGSVFYPKLTPIRSGGG